jgi:hypothetical protein
MFEPNSRAVAVVLMNRFGAGAHVPTSVFRTFADELRPFLPGAPAKCRLPDLQHRAFSRRTLLP